MSNEEQWVEYEHYFVPGAICKCGKLYPKYWPWYNRYQSPTAIPEVCPRCGTLHSKMKETSLVRHNWKKERPWYLKWQGPERKATYTAKGGRA